MRPAWVSCVLLSDLLHGEPQRKWAMEKCIFEGCFSSVTPFWWQASSPDWFFPALTLNSPSIKLVIISSPSPLSLIKAIARKSYYEVSDNRDGLLFHSISQFKSMPFRRSTIYTWDSEAEKHYLHKILSCYSAPQGIQIFHKWCPQN